MKKEEYMGDKFREAFKDFERKPSAKVWSNIENVVNQTNTAKFNFFNSKNLIIGSTVVALILVILYILIPTNHLQTSIVQTLDTKKITSNNSEVKEAVHASNSLPTIKAAAAKKVGEDVKTPNAKENIAQKQNIRDIIAQLDNNQKLTENKNNQIERNALQVSTTNTIASNQKITNVQPTSKINAALPKAMPITDIKFSPDQKICKGEKLTLSVTNAVSCLWSTGERTQFIVVSPTSSTDYSVIATDENGNRKTGLITVTVSECNAPFIPNAFTPNGDGQSDVFKVYGSNISNFEIIILSRSGKLVYTSRNIDEGWNGNSKEGPAPTGVYVYTIKYTNELNTQQTLAGHVTLIR
ncbi:MAG: gliding motility-associated C-terminal domain-containing protein [Bacteroidota bacterium]